MLKYPDGTHVNSVSYAKMFFMSPCCVMIRVGRNEGEELGSLRMRERERNPYNKSVFLSSVSLAFCLIICMYNFVHSSVIYVIVTSVYTPCIYTFYKYIYKNIWTIHHDQCLLEVLMYIIALFLLFFYHLDGFKLWPFGRNQPVLVRKLSWDWMSITGWR